MSTLPADTLRLHGEKNNSSTAGAGSLPALSGFIARKVIASGKEGRAAVIEVLRAELAWAEARWHRDNPNASADRAQGAAPRLPHEHAAAVALNCYEHLLGTETRIVACWRRMHLQRRARWDWSATAIDLRWYISERRKQRKAFNEAVEAYRKLRVEVDPPAGPACAKEAA